MRFRRPGANPFSQISHGPQVRSTALRVLPGRAVLHQNAACFEPTGRVLAANARIRSSAYRQDDRRRWPRSHGGRRLPPDPAFGDRADRSSHAARPASSRRLLATSRDFAGTFSRGWRQPLDAERQLGGGRSPSARRAGGCRPGTAALRRWFTAADVFLGQWRSTSARVAALGFVRLMTRERGRWTTGALQAVLRYGPELSMLANWDYAGRLQLQILEFDLG
jgi:hypothetical protein